MTNSEKLPHRHITVKEVMTENVINVKQDLPVTEVFNLLDKHFISGMPVVDDKELYVGVISKTDLVKPVVIDHIQKMSNLDVLLVKDVMNARPLVTVNISADVGDVLATMVEEQVHRVFVEDDQKKIVGVVSGLDIKRCCESGIDSSL